MANPAKYPVSCLLPRNTHCQGGFYPDSALSFYPQAGLAQSLGTFPVELLGWMKTSEIPTLTAVESNLRAAIAQRNASEWCSAVDRVEKEVLSLISITGEIGPGRISLRHL